MARSWLTFLFVDCCGAHIGAHALHIFTLTRLQTDSWPGDFLCSTVQGSDLPAHDSKSPQARIIREVARQDLLPYPSFFASTKPFGTPLGPVALKAVLTVIVILAVPARDTFNFVLDLASYPNLVSAVPLRFRRVRKVTEYP